MASKAHQFIVDLLARRMSMDGYEVVSFDGHSETENTFSHLPPTIKRHRPDIVGIKKDILAIGEAKTAGDLGDRTHEQIEDYVTCSKELTGRELKIYLGVPNSIESKTKAIVNAVNGGDVVILLTVPDRLLPQDHD
jgi:hypothetical protein